MSPENSNVLYGRIMILDDHELFGQALRVMLQQMLPDAEVNYFNMPETARKELHLRDYQFLLVDLLIPETNVYDFISFCKTRYDKLNIIVISSTTDHNAVKRCIELGASGYLSKSTSADELRMALEKTSQGKRFISSDLGVEFLSGHFQKSEGDLTPKEAEVLKLIVQGHKVRNTADLLNISPYTVMAHRRNIMKKLQLHSAAELVRYAFENNLIS